jgi:hypothetical protein
VATGTVVSFTVGRLATTSASLAVLAATDKPAATLTATAARGGPT